MEIQGAFPKTFQGLGYLEQPITLNYNENSFNISLEIADYQFPEKTDYYYKVDEATNFWTKVEGNTINFSNINYGKYNLLVKAAYQSTDNAPIATLALNIKPPWHKSIVAYTLLFIGLALALFSFFQLRYKQKIASNKLKVAEEIDRVKSNLFTNISHELRTPLTLISGPIERQLSKERLSPQDKAELSLVQRNSKRLMNLVNQLLDLSKLESGSLKLSISQVNISLLLNQLTAAFQFKAQEKNINFSSEIVKGASVYFDKDVVEKIVTNLLSNAIKYTPENGQVRFNAIISEGQLIISVVNNGNTLTNYDLPKLFKRFYQTSKNSDGVGVGLSLVKELTTFSHGNIVANTLEDDFIQFTVTLPIERSFFNPSEIVETQLPIEENSLEELGFMCQDAKESKQEKPLLLIVEDDVDVRQFTRSIFESDYKILEANNGERGIKKAIKNIPDIIISDVMMPAKTGTELCEELKNDERTSHIPNILLTAKVGEEHDKK
jgi:signal transduction histidine kinase/CheY-like chemotaxis protein